MSPRWSLHFTAPHMTYNTQKQHILTWFSLLWSIIVGYIVARGAYLVYTHYQYLNQQKRHSSLLLFMEGVKLFFIFIIEIPTLLYMLKILTYLTPTLIDIWFILYFQCISIMIWAALLIHWFNFFYLKYYSKLLNNQWIQFINASNYHSNWFVNNKNKYGSFNYVVNIFISLYFIQLIINVIIFFLFQNKGCVYNAILLIFVPGIPITLIYIKTPKFEDKLHLRFVIKFCIIYTSFFGFLAIINMILLFFFHSDGDKRYYLFLSLFNILATMCLYHPFVINWKYLTKFKISFCKFIFGEYVSDFLCFKTSFFNKRNATLSSINCSVRYPLHIDMNINKKLLSTFEPKSESRSLVKNSFNQYDLLSFILNDKDGILLFGQYLLYEICIEQLLAVIEITEFQQMYILNDNNMNILKISEYIPKSDIVHNNSYTMNDKIELLFNKYVKNGSQFQLNLDDRTNKEIQTMMDGINDINHKDLTHIFDKVLNEILYLMVDSFNRFKNTKTGKQITQNLNDNDNFMCLP